MFATQHALLKLMDRFLRLHDRQPIGTLDIAWIFPKLVCIRVEHIVKTPPPRKFNSHLEVFKPMSLDELYKLYHPDYYIREQGDPCFQRRLCLFDQLHVITDIHLKKGAYLLSSSALDSDFACQHQVALWPKRIETLSLRIDDQVLDATTISTFEVVLDIISLSMRPLDRPPLLGDTPRHSGLALTCHPQVLETFIRNVSCV
jgi:hypothetical protein